MTRVLVIAGTASEVGKTSITLGLARALRNRGVRVLAAKVGPDYLDPKQLARATGRDCLNLDAFMMGKAYVLDLIARVSPDIDLLLVEGVMGLYDGVAPDSNHGSTAEMAEWLSANVLLVADARAQARSFAALVQGFCRFESGCRIAGVIANRVGSDAHAELLSAALASVDLPPLLGHLPNGALPNLPSRHLGLIEPRDDDALEALAAAVEHHLAIERILNVATPALTKAHAEERLPRSNLRLAVAEDAAFSFVYTDLRQSLQSRGVEWLPCSPLHDRQMPEDAHALYIPGGYPEEYAEPLAHNREFLESLRTFAMHRPIYAECGGLMLLGESLVARDGRAHSMAGILPGHTRMRDRLVRLGYTEVTLLRDSLWGRAGDKCRGHEFHFSEFTLDARRASEWQCVYQVDYRHGRPTTEGYQRGNVLASYVHLHLASRPKLLAQFLERLTRT